MPALVLGGAGFIASHLVDELLVSGMEVMVIDDLSTGKLENLRRWQGNPKLDFVRIDVQHAGQLQRALDHKGWVFSFLPFVPVPLPGSCLLADTKRLVLNFPSHTDLPFCSHLLYGGSTVYGPRGPKTGDLFVSDVVRANMMVVMDYELRGPVQFEQLMRHVALVSPTQGQSIIEAYDRANSPSIIVTR
jgi:hypothetical protein